MDVSLANPFISATINVIDIMANIQCEPGKIFIKENKTTTGDITGIIGLSGVAKGSIAISFDESTILKIVANMFGENVQRIDDEISDAVGEIANMISGQARKELSGRGKYFKAAIPTIVVGKNHVIQHITGDPIIAIPFSTPEGKFLIEICMEDTRNK